MDKRTLKNIGVLGLLPFGDQLYYDKADAKLIDTTNYNESNFWKLVRSQYNCIPISLI